MKICIRPLEESDALLSYKWRNDPDIWKYTGNKPDRRITLKIEKEWIKKVLKRKNEKRFAICIGEKMKYVGNVQLTDITSNKAQLHIFIGGKNLHGKGTGTKATRLILKYAFDTLKLKQVNLKVNLKNSSAINLYKKFGFVNAEKRGNYMLMELISFKK